jgi:predicted alpha-1,2-mannosidase
MNRFFNLLLAILFSINSEVQSANTAKSPAQYVNPFIGASTSIGKAGVYHGLGKTFPGADTPFGLVQLSPNTITGGDNGSGYSYEHTTIEGFAFTQMSGVGWYGDLGNFLVMPTTGELKTSSGRVDYPGEGYRSRYDKNSETAQAGYYSVKLTDYNILAEATVAPHSGILRFTFPESKNSRIQIDLARRVGGTSTEQYVKVVDDHTIEGWMKCPPEGGGWGNGAGKADYTVYFYAEFSKPLTNFGVWSANIPDGTKRNRQYIESNAFRELVANSEIKKQCKEITGKHLGFYTEFATKANEQVLIQSGISFVSMEGARKNLKAEITDFDFEKVRKNAFHLWNDALGKITVSGGTEEQKTVFYTALYHTMIDPRSFADADGSYVGGDKKVHQNTKFTKRTIFSGWDVFRSQFPLQNIINPAVVNDMVNSLIELADETGNKYFERWEFLNAYSGCMIGNPAVSVMVDAYNKGIRRFDVAKGYEFAKNSCDKFGNGDLQRVRTGKTVAGKGEFGISTTLEYAYFEWCLSVFADSLKNKADAQKYRDLSGSYKAIFDQQLGWFRPKKMDGSWVPLPKDGRLAQDYGSVESNPYQQGWFVPHDPQGLANLLGGTAKALSDLTDFFEKAPKTFTWNNYYNHPNEPVHLTSFLFNEWKAPWLTQKWVRTICENAYHNTVEGLVGNEDVGQMSAWYVLAASGFHPSCPGNNRYEIFTPVFSKVVIQTDPVFAKGRTFIISAQNNSAQNKYIQSARLNGKAYNKCYLTYSDIINGGKLELILGPEPNTNWGLEN